ncbi:hypothetical protein GOBAR_DD01870 [Gossypium barbadense]|nr:hypothetical protein GOBAR_DD01870 [Gossypium barbadense]
MLCDPNCSKHIREKAAFGVTALIRVNKDVLERWGSILMRMRRVGGAGRTEWG